MVYSASQDLTAAWYAAAPPPPPPAPAGQSKASVGARPTSMVGSPVYGNNKANDGLRTSSSSMSMSFDRRLVGDDLPTDSHSPEPERPVSRNAMARARERERQRARSNSTAGYHSSGMDGEPSEPSEGAGGHLYAATSAPDRSSSPGPRTRRESSPATAGAWSTYPQQGPVQHVQSPMPMSYAGQQPMSAPQHPYSVPASPATPMYAPQQTVASGQSTWSPYHAVGNVPASQYQTPPQTYGQPVYYTPPQMQMQLQHQQQPQQQQQQPVYTHPGHFAAAAAAPQHPHGQWSPAVQHMYTSEPMPMHQTPIYSTAVSPAPSHSWTPPMPGTPQQQVAAPPAAVPFPSTTMPPPPPPQQASVMQVYPAHGYKTPPAANGRPLPSPSRSSSQSSSVGTRASTTSLGSVSSTTRRTLPQPPMRSESGPQPVPSNAAVRRAEAPSTLGRHESVRVAAEEIMSRGPPRRKGLPSTVRSNAHANASRSDGSITDGTAPGGSHRPVPPVAPLPRGRAESGSCLEKEMRAMKIQDDSRYTSATPPRAPLSNVQPTADRTGHAPSHVPVPISDVPVRASSPRPIRAAPAPAPEVTVAVPDGDLIPQRPLSRGPKDERERRKSMDVGSVFAPSPVQIHSPPPDAKPPVPTISFDMPQSSSPGIPSIVLPGEEQDRGEDAGPAIQVSGPEICVSGGEDENEKPTGTISISVSSSGLAQRSTTTGATGGGPPVPALGRTTAPFAAPEPASAPSVGSGAGCATCKKWIGGRVVHALSHTFHPDCFVCFHCSEALEHVAFYEHEGRPYCHFDYHELFSKRCFHCRTPIVDQRYITINDVELVGAGADGLAGQPQERCYHDLHFFCANCGDPFLDPKVASSAAGADVLSEIEDENGTVRYGGREFVVHKGYPYCEKCHVSLHKPRCKGCRQPIIDEDYLTALRAKWHVGCFCCQRCQHPIDSDNFFVRDGQAYDEQCYKIKLRSEL